MSAGNMAGLFYYEDGDNAGFQIFVRVILIDLLQEIHTKTITLQVRVFLWSHVPHSP
jgi:hypothetical protein